MIPNENFYKGGGGGRDVKGCMLNTGVGHSASASYSLLMSVPAFIKGSSAAQMYKKGGGGMPPSCEKCLELLGNLHYQTFIQSVTRWVELHMFASQHAPRDDVSS